MPSGSSSTFGIAEAAGVGPAELGEHVDAEHVSREPEGEVVVGGPRRVGGDEDRDVVVEEPEEVGEEDAVATVVGDQPSAPGSGAGKTAQP